MFALKSFATRTTLRSQGLSKSWVNPALLQSSMLFSEEAQNRIRGVVTRFDTKRGYGIIKGMDGNQYYLHYSDINQEGYRSAGIGQIVEFDVAAAPNSDKLPRAIKANGINGQLLKYMPKKKNSSPTDRQSMSETNKNPTVTPTSEATGNM